MARGLRLACPTAAMAAALLVLLVILSLAVHGSAASPPRGTVKIKHFSYGGSGCPPGSAEGEMSPDARALGVIFSGYVARTDGSLRDRKKSCVVSVRLSYPQGWTFAIAQVSLRGYANLHRGSYGQIQTWYYYSGFPKTRRLTRRLRGPFDNDFASTDKLYTLIYLPCGTVRNLNLASEIKVHPGRTNGYALMELDYPFRYQFWEIVWKRC